MRILVLLFDRSSRVVMLLPLLSCVRGCVFISLKLIADNRLRCLYCCGMAIRNNLLGCVLVLAVGGIAMIASPRQSGATQYTYLCTSVPSACEYGPPTSPALSTDVCWDGQSATLMPSTGCPSWTTAYYVTSGEVVDPRSNQIQAYIPLDDACDMGFCDYGPPPSTAQPGPMCCNADGCWASEYANCTGVDQVFLWCAAGEEPGQQNGSWKCYENE